MSLDNELAQIEMHLGSDPKKYRELLYKLQIESTVTPSGISLMCPHCITKRRSINIRIVDNKYSCIKWRCYGCDDNPHLKYYDNLIGLVRFFHPQFSPREIINLMKDAAYQPAKSAPNIVLPFGQYKNQPLGEVPYSYLEWLCKSDILNNDPHLHHQISDYLYGSPENDQSSNTT